MKWILSDSGVFRMKILFMDAMFALDETDAQLMLHSVGPFDILDTVGRPA